MAANRPLVISQPEVYAAPEKSDYFFIIWNLFVTDKLTPLKLDVLKKANIAEIVAILPEEKDFQTVNADIGDIPVTVLAYHHNHTPALPREQYDDVAKKIDELAKRPREKPRNVLVFCNNGYQRSLPFLVYYMTKYHADEFPTVEKAVAAIFPVLRSSATFEQKVAVMNRIKELFQAP